MAQETGEVFLVLLEIDHPSLTTPIRVTSDAAFTVSGGNTFLPFPFQFTFPDDQTDQIPIAKLTIDNIDLSIITAIRSMGNTPATVVMYMVLASTPNVVENTIAMTMRNVNYDALTVTCDLRFEEILDEPYPGDQVTPATIPGVFSIEQ